MERAIQTYDPDAVNGGEGGEDSRVHRGLTTCKLVPQRTFKPTRRQKELWDSQIIEFSVRGEKGLRLSDASGGNWAGFEGKDDRSLFEDDRLQVMVRLHVRLPTVIYASPPC